MIRDFIAPKKYIGLDISLNQKLILSDFISPFHSRLIWAPECGGTGDSEPPRLVSLDVSDNYLALSSVNLSALSSLASLSLGQRDTRRLVPSDLQHLPRSVRLCMLYLLYNDPLSQGCDQSDPELHGPPRDPGTGHPGQV